MTFPISSSKKRNLIEALGSCRLASPIPLLLALLASVANAASNPDDISFLSNNAQTISVRYRTPAIHWQAVQIGGKTYSTPRIAGTGLSWAEGMPQLPVRVVWLAIPPGSTASLGSVSAHSGAPMPQVPAPTPTQTAGPGGSVESVYAEDAGYYGSGAPFPQSWVELTGPENYRDLRVVRLLIYPCRFPSSDGGTLVLDSIDVVVQLQGAQAGAGLPRPMEEELYTGLISNWQGAARSWKMPKAAGLDMTDPWPSGDLYKVKIEESGIYRITHDDLIEAGIDLQGLDPKTIRLFNNGGTVLPKNLITPRAQEPIENAIMITGEQDGSFDQGDEILFYGQSVHDWSWSSSKDRYLHYRNPYTDYNIYWLNINPQGPQHAQMAPLGVSAAAALTPQFTRAYYVDERELNVVYDSFNLPVSMPDFYGDVFSGPSSRTYSFNLEGTSASAGAHLTLKLRYADALPHSFQVFLNEVLIFTTSSTINERELSPGALVAGGNSLRVQHLGNGTVFMDYFEIEYTRDLQSAAGGQLAFVSPDADGIAQYTIGQAGGGWTPEWIFDITNYAGVKVAQAATFKDSSSAQSPRRYLAITSEALRQPISITQDTRSGDEYANLRISLEADIVVICADDFYETMAAYEDYRENEAPNPVEVLRVKVSDIFDEYGWGLVDPAAIRDFLKTSLPLYNWALSPVYVLFAGDGDFDYKNRLATGDANWVIPFESGIRCTDDWYSYFGPTDNSQAFPELVTGRWPAQSVDELEEMINRLIAYETQGEYGPWQNTITFVADDEYGERGVFMAWETTHTKDTEIIAENFIPKTLNLNKIYLTEYPVTFDPAGGGRRKPAAAAALVAAINEGRLIVNYMGHGNPSVWAHEHVFLQSRDLPQLNNGEKLPLFVAATCDWAYWDSPFDQSMPELMLTLPGGGCIAGMGATRVTGPGANAMLAQNFYEALFEVPGGRKLGQALMLAKSRFFQHNNAPGYSSNENSEKYHLLGDPLMRLAMPELPVEIASGSSDTLYALSHAQLGGQILTQSGDPITTFSGIAHLQVFDTRIQVLYTFPNETTTTYCLPGNLIFRGDCSVQSGQFQSSFVVPVDINYGGAGGRYSVLVYSDEISGSGASDTVVFAPTATTLQDSTPPQVVLYFDSPAFRSGEKVSPEAVLYVQVSDSNGVNLTGSTGHGIVVTIDGQSPIDLTDAFSYDLNSSMTGRAQYQFAPGELSGGVHQAEAMAWDAANNPSTSQVTFEVLTEGDLGLADLLNYPNPFSGTTRFTFRLTEAPAIVSIKVYTVAGRVVKEIREVPVNDVYDVENPNLIWDGRDEEGDLLSNGVYLYKVFAQSLDGRTAEELGKLVFLR